MQYFLWSCWNILSIIPGKYSSNQTKWAIIDFSHKRKIASNQVIQILNFSKKTRWLKPSSHIMISNWCNCFRDHVVALSIVVNISGKEYSKHISIFYWCNNFHDLVDIKSVITNIPEQVNRIQINYAGTDFSHKREHGSKQVVNILIFNWSNTFHYLIDTLLVITNIAE